jgi:oligopeptide transport system ATP-binding protein
MSLLEVHGLVKRFSTRRSLWGRTTEWFTAVDGIDLHVESGETLAVVGESGAGKSTLGRLVLRLIEATEGEIQFDGSDLRALDRRGMRALRRDAQMVFQDPYSSLDPHLPVGVSIGEPLQIHFGTGRKERDRRSAELLDRVGLRRHIMNRYPSELSGGQLQRVCIARALTLEPRLIVCDEPVAALDVSVRAQVLNLMREIQIERNLTYLFVSHDLALVEVIADRVAVMSKGKVVELGTTEEIFRSPAHEYTNELLAAIPMPVPPGLAFRTERGTALD